MEQRSARTMNIPDGLPQLRTLTGAGIITALFVLAVSLIGAVFGGLAGMRFHRKVDRTSLDTDAYTVEHRLNTQ